MAAGGSESRGEARPLLPLGCLLALAVALGLGLQGCMEGDDPSEEPSPSLVLKPSQLTTNASRKAAIKYNRVARDCTGTYLASKLNRSSNEFRNEAIEQLQALEDIPLETRKSHVDTVFPEDAAGFFIDDADSGFLRKAEVYCHIRRHLNDMPGKAQLDSMVEEVQSRVSHITQFLPENAYGFLEAQKSSEAMKAMKKYYGLLDLSDELFIKLREVVIPLKEEQMKTALYAVSAFATGGCLRHYFEVTLSAKKCPWEMDNEPIHDEEAEAANKMALEDEQAKTKAEEEKKDDDTAGEEKKREKKKEKKTEKDEEEEKTTREDMAAISKAAQDIIEPASGEASSALEQAAVAEEKDVMPAAVERRLEEQASNPRITR